MEAIKAELMLEIQSTNDVEFLEGYLAWIKLSKNDRPYPLTPAMNDRIAFAKQQIKEGRTMTHEKAMERLEELTGLK